MGEQNAHIAKASGIQYAMYVTGKPWSVDMMISNNNETRSDT